MQVALATCSMSKTVQKAPGADGLRRLWTWAKQCKKHLEQMAYAACGHGQNSAKSTWSRRLTPPVAMGKTVQKAPGVDSKRRLWPCDALGWRQGLRPPPSHLPRPPRHTWRAGARAPPGPGQVATGGFSPLQATCPPSLATRGGLEHVRHLGLGRWLQVASAPPSHLPRPPRHTWRAGARAPPGPDGWAGGARWLRPLQATCMPPLATPGGPEHVRHLAQV
jgi:hypothetical protein